MEPKFTKQCGIQELLESLKAGNNFSICQICTSKECPCNFKNNTLQEVVTEYYINLTKVLVRRICFGSGQKEDFVAAGFLGLAKALNKINETIDDPDAYIVQSIIRNIKIELVKNTLIPVPHSGFKKGYRKACGYQIREEELAVPPQQTTVDIKDFVKKIPDSEAEKVILKFVLEGGYKDYEIAEEAHLSTRRTNQIKNALLTKLFKELCDE